MLERFFTALDKVWPKTRGPKIELRIIGSTALMLQTAFRRGTKDSDVLETQDFDPETQRRLLAAAGKDSPLHGTHRLYLEVVPAGLPFLPQACIWHVDNLHRVERDFYAVAETAIELPSWCEC